MSWKTSIKIRFKWDTDKSLEWSEHFDANGKKKTSCNNERSNKPEPRMTVYDKPMPTWLLSPLRLFPNSLLER